MRPASRPAELTAGPFTSAEAVVAGLTRKQLRSRCWRRLFKDVYVPAELPDTLELRAAGIRLVLPPDAVVGRTSAAWLLGADVRRPGDVMLDVIGQRGDQIRRPGVRATSALLEPDDVTEVLGIPVTTPTRTAFDLARRPELVEAVVGLDAMLNKGGASIDGLATYVAEHRRWWGVRYAEAALSHAEPLAQSPMETRQRMELVLAGLPRPQAQVPVEDEWGLPFAYLDNGYEQWRVGVDYDGEPHRDRWRYDLERQERIRDRGWWHRRYSVIESAAGWRAMVEHVAGALMRAGWRSGPADHAPMALTRHRMRATRA